MRRSPLRPDSAEVHLAAGSRTGQAVATARIASVVLCPALALGTDDLEVLVELNVDLPPTRRPCQRSPSEQGEGDQGERQQEEQSPNPSPLRSVDEARRPGTPERLVAGLPCCALPEQGPRGTGGHLVGLACRGIL